MFLVFERVDNPEHPSLLIEVVRDISLSYFTSTMRREEQKEKTLRGF